MKVFPGVVALDKVSIDFYPGEVHALIGENGAGKSTFIKTITGAHAPDGGTITVDGQTYKAMTPALARQHGIECIYQEFNLIDVLSAAENICYGEKLGPLVNQKKMNQIAQAVFDDFGVDIDPSTLVRDLTPGRMQIVEIAKAVSKKVRVLIRRAHRSPVCGGGEDPVPDRQQAPCRGRSHHLHLPPSGRGVRAHRPGVHPSGR